MEIAAYSLSEKERHRRGECGGRSPRQGGDECKGIVEAGPLSGRQFKKGGAGPPAQTHEARGEEKKRHKGRSSTWKSVCKRCHSRRRTNDGPGPTVPRRRSAATNVTKKIRPRSCCPSRSCFGSGGGGDCARKMQRRGGRVIDVPATHGPTAELRIRRAYADQRRQARCGKKKGPDHQNGGPGGPRQLLISLAGPISLLNNPM